MELADWIIRYRRRGKSVWHYALVSAGSAEDSSAILGASLADFEQKRYEYEAPIKRPKQLREGRVLEKQMDVE